MQLSNNNIYISYPNTNLQYYTMESNNNNSSGKPLTTDQQSSIRTSSTPNPQSTPNHYQTAPVSALESLIAAAKTDTDVYNNNNNNNNEVNHTPQRDNNNGDANEPPSTGRFQLAAVQQLQNITVPIGELNLDAFPNPTGDGIIIKNIGKKCQSKGRLHIGDRIVSFNGGSVNAIEDIHRHDGSAERRFVVYRATKSDNTAPAPSSTRASADNGNADTPLRNNTSAPSTKSSGRIAKSNLVIKAPPTVKRRESLTTLQQLSGVAACDSSDNDEEASNTEKEKSSGNEEEDVFVNSNYTRFTVTYYEGDRYDFGVTGYDEDSGAYTIGFKDGFISESDDCLMDTDLLLEISGYNIKNMIPFSTKGGCPSDRLVRNLIRDARQPVTLTFLRPNNVESESEEEDEPISPEKVNQEVVDLAEDYSEGDSEDESDSEEDEVEVVAVNKKRVTMQPQTEDDEEDESMKDEEEEEEGVVFDGGDYDDGYEEEVEEEVVVERGTGDTSPARRSATAASSNNG